MVLQNKATTEDAINFLNTQLGTDEAVTSENFAYLSYLMMAGERTDEYLGLLDEFIESKKPIFSQLMKQVPPAYQDFKNNLIEWKPILVDVEKILKPSNATTPPGQ